MRPICVKCHRFFRAKKNGFYFLEGMPLEQDALPGTEEPEKWGVCRMWVGDLWECPNCQVQIVSGVAAGPLAEEHEDDFADQVRKLNAVQFQVNDC